MRIDCPAPETVPALRQLWQAAFGDSDAFLDGFFSAGFRPERCRCIFAENTVAAALYWFDCTLAGRKLAYLYAVATAPRFRGRGLCRMLMEDTRKFLHGRGYTGAVLVPGEKGLFEMYGRLGYRVCSGVTEFSCDPEGPEVPLRQVDASEYAALRRLHLPAGGVIQEGENLSFLQTQAELYAGDGFVLAAVCEKDTLTAAEYLGDPALAPGIVKALKQSRGQFRTPGNSRSFAMYLPLAGAAPVPEYFGLAFD